MDRSIITDTIRGIVALLSPTPKADVVTTNDINGKRVVVHHKDFNVSIFEGDRYDNPAHTFTSIEDFAAWLNREANEERFEPNVVDVLVGERGIVATEDSRSQQAAQVCCALDAHPLWSAWKSIAAGGWMKSGDLFEHLRLVEDTFGNDMQRVDGKLEPVAAGPAIMASMRTVSASKSGDMSIERDAGGMARLMAKNSKTTISNELRERWPLSVPVFDAAADIVVDCEAVVSWRMTKDDDELMFRVRLPAIAMVEREARQRVVEALREMAPAYTIGSGEARLSNGTVK